MSDDLKKDKLNNEDLPKDVEPKDTKPEEPKEKDTKPEEPKDEETKPEAPKGEETKPEDSESEENKSEDSEGEETEQEEAEGEEQPKGERIEDWVAKETKAKYLRLFEQQKKYLIGGAIAIGVLLLVGLVLLLSRKPATNGGVKISYLEGLDVMCGPNGIAPDGEGGFLVTDVYGKKIWKTKGKNAQVYAGAATVKDPSGQPMGGYQDSTFEESLFREPWAIAPFLGGFAVSDTANHVVRLLKDGNVETINGHSDTLESGEMGVTFDTPTGLAADNQGNLYVADSARGIIYVISEQGVVDVYWKDLNGPTGICWKDGVLYIAETAEHRIIKLIGGNMVVVAGTGEEGEDDGAAASATFSNPEGVCVAKDGTIYVSDTVNATVRRIKNGKVDTILEMLEDGLTTYPVNPVGMCYQDGTLYVCDPFSRRVYIIKH